MGQMSLLLLPILNFHILSSESEIIVTDRHIDSLIMVPFILFKDRNQKTTNNDNKKTFNVCYSEIF